MNATHAFLLVEALQATAIVGAALALMLCALRRSALRHAVGVVGLGLLLASPLLALLLPRPAWLPAVGSPVVPEAAPATQLVAAPPTPPVELAPGSENIAETTGYAWPDELEFRMSPPVDAFEAAEELEPAAPAPALAVSEPNAPEQRDVIRSAASERLPWLMTAAGGVWILGALWCVLRWGRSHVRLRRLRRSLSDWPAGRHLDDAGTICSELGLRELPPVKVSEIAPMPLVLGVLRPVIVLPQSLANTHSPAQLKDVILHEAAHIARRDPLVFVVQRVVAALLWWHPGVHWLNRAISRAREEVCDNHVLRRGDAAAYAELLLELVEHYAGMRRELSLMGLLATRWSLEQRIAGLLNPQRNTRTRAGRVQTLLAAVLLLLLCAGVGGLGIVGQLRAAVEAAESRDPAAVLAVDAPGVAGSTEAAPATERSTSWPNFRNGTGLRGIATTTLSENLELLWERKTHDGMTSTAAIADGRVYVAELSGHVRCLDLHSGWEIWHFRTTQSENPDEFAPGFHAPVTLSETALFIGDEEGTFYALDRESGALLWKIKTDDAITGGATVLPPDPLLGVPRVMFGSHGGKLYCLDAATGDELWAFDTMGPVNGSQAVDGQFAFVSGCDRPVLRIVDVNSGEQHAAIGLDDSLLVASPALVGNVLYFGTQDGNINAFDWQSKLRKWTWSGPKQPEFHSSPAVTDNLVLIGGRDKRLHAINRANGEQVWEFETRGAIDSSPVVVGERVFFGSGDRHVYAVDLQGHEVWRHNGGGRISAAPAVGEGHLVIGCEGPGGRILCFGAKRESATAESDQTRPAAPAMRKVTLRGVCEDEDQRPLAGLRVRVFRFPSPLDPPVQVAETTTDPQGRFVVENVETDPAQLESRGIGDLVVATTADNRASAVMHIHDEQQFASLKLALHSNAGTLSGVVRDEQGRPIAGATVQFPTGFLQPLPGIMSTVTDDEGRYAITDLRCWKAADTMTFDPKTKTGTRLGACFFHVQHPDFAITQGQYTAIPQTVDVTLHPPALVTGQVLDAVTGQPASGVIVSAQGIARHGWAQGRTGADGRYRLKLTKDHYNIWADMPERIAIAAKAVEAKPGATADGADIRLVRGGFVFGSLIDPATNQPIQPDRRTYVAHYGPARPRSGAAVSNTVVQPDGSYRLRVAPGRNFVYLQSGYNGGVELEIGDGQEVRHDFRIGERSPDSFSDRDPDIEIGDRIRQRARDEDAVAARRAGNTTTAPAARDRRDTAIGRLLSELEQQNASDTERFREPWLRILKQIVDLGPDAVPELIAELDATTDNMMLRCLGFALRAIGDQRAIPALIRTIPKTLMPPGSDMGLQADDAELAAFAQQHDLDDRHTGGEYAFGRPVREVFGALHQLTGQNFDEEELFSVNLQGTRNQQRLQRQLYHRCARRWADWWEEHWSEHVTDADYARVKLPEPAAAVAEIVQARESHYKSGENFSNYLLESALGPTPGRHELFDLDTGRGAAVPPQWRKTIGGDGYGRFVEWAADQGFDLLGHEYVVPGSGRRVYAIRRLSGKFWELGDDTWKRTYNDITFGEIQQKGRPVDGHWLLRRDPQTGDIDPLARATFLFQTSEETPGLLSIGVEVQDDSLKPGAISQGDDELHPIAFNKGRRFAFTFLEELAASDKRTSRAVEQPRPAETSQAPSARGGSAGSANSFAVNPAASETAPDPIDLGRSAHFSGQVTDPDGRPLRGARVYIVRYPRRPTSEWRETQLLTDPGPVRAVTDADGRYAFDAPDMLSVDDDGQPARTEALIIAAADGYAPDWTYVWDRSQLLGRDRRRASQASFNLQLGRDDVAIKGQLLDPGGRPLAGGVVRVSELRIPDKRTLDTYIDYWSRDDSGVGNGPEYERSISTPAVLPGVTVQVATDAEGRFTIAGLGDERIVELWVTAPGMVETNLVVMTRKAPEVGTRRWQGKPQDTTYGAEFSVRLELGRTVTGVVIDRETRKPIPGIWVGIGRRNAPNETLAKGRSHHATDENGRFTITGVWPKLLESGSRSFREVVAVAPPGGLYETTTVLLDPSGELVIECRRGIPFRLKVTDEQGQPVTADVTYVDIQPNPHSHAKRQGSNPYARPSGWPISRAAHRGDGVYEGFVLPGPGAILVQTPDSARDRPAHVNPKGFFAPARTEWTAQEQITAYGTHDTLSTSQVWINQHDYSAIVLISPPGESAPLELSATVYKDRPRQVTLVDPDGQPVVGATTEGMTFFPWDHELPLRSATFRVTGLRPDWGRRITFFDEPRKLIGFLSAMSDGDAPYTVRMQPWASVWGRIVDEDGHPVDLSLNLGYEGAGTVVDQDPDVGIHRGAGTDSSGLFSIDRLVPGQRYTARAHRDRRQWGTAFEDLVLAPGENRDLGVIRVRRPADDPKPADQSPESATAPPTKPAAITDLSLLGRIEGQFVFDGEPPQLPPVSTRGGMTVPDESLTVNPDNKGIANVCVYLEETPPRMPNAFRRPGGAPPVFDIQNGRFVPHVLVLRSDHQVRLLNGERETVNPRSSGEGGFFPLNTVLKPNERDGVTHNIHYADMRRPPATITSELQPWMRAYWLVSNHPYAAVTDADGKFTIENLPPGEHTFRVWHERAGYVTTEAFNENLTVTVKPGETVQLPAFRVKGAEFEE